MEWLEESITKSTREIQSNSVAETEQILERHEKNLDQLDKKKKVFMDQKSKGEKLLNDPRAPKFLNGHMDRLMGLWKEANNKGEDRLEDLKNNLVAWEAYENKRNQLDDQLNQVGNIVFALPIPIEVAFQNCSRGLNRIHGLNRIQYFE